MYHSETDQVFLGRDTIVLAKQADEIAAGDTDSLSQPVHPDLLGKMTLQIPRRIGCIGDLLSRDHTQGSAVGGTV